MTFGFSLDLSKLISPSMKTIILASGSTIRSQLLKNAGVPFDTIRPNIDEAQLKDEMILKNMSPTEVAANLSSAKANAVSLEHPDSIVIGSDQVLSVDGALLSKPRDRKDLAAQLNQMKGRSHHLYTSAAIHHLGRKIWSTDVSVELTMKDLTDEFLASYVNRNWDKVKYCVGGYQLENEGIRLFSQIKGDYFHVLGFPLLEVLNFLAPTGEIDK